MNDVEKAWNEFKLANERRIAEIQALVERPAPSVPHPVWLLKAQSYLGLKEIVGRKHNPIILRWWSKIRAPFTDDETPWCAAFVGGVLEECGIVSTRSAAARSYERWGTEIDGPRVGCIVVFWRKSPKHWSGHVGFVVGRNEKGQLLVLGGNQGNSVSIKPFDGRRVVSYHWPSAHEAPISVGMASLPELAINGAVSTNEA